MNWSLRKLTCKQLMNQLSPLQNIIIPSNGWLKTIRTAIGMTSQQLARRCGVSKQRILRIENDEVLMKTTLATLEKVASQLGCKLVYAIVPEKNLLNIIEEQAERTAIDRLKKISHSMILEDQKVIDKKQQEQIEILKEELMKNNIKTIWQ
ncbi:mobile mystery protein A [Candidatus Tisiphia endosymbiont of Myopa tessellatipennis]|uniref:mobile mystery protein A n=1 Tax=Candidatus Tisiphia endosymbiont of Myopa tessellatipennis TaxID=3066257 RepID=UPI00313E68F2